MPTCSHGKTADRYLPEWESLVEGLPVSAFNYPACFCEPPGSFDRRNIERARQLVLEAQMEKERWLIEWEARKKSEKKPPGKSEGVGSDDSDESAGRWYFITFTQPNTDKDPHALLKRTQKVVKSKMVSAIHWCYSLELTESGTPHTHIRLFSKKYFDYKKVANFNDGYRAEVAKEKWTSGKYTLKKDIDEEYLAAHNLTQWYWNSPEYFSTTGSDRPE